jgi:DNA-directed RNA polymerase subunit RPC12/RpoP
VANPQTSNEEEREISTICPSCWKQFSVPRTESHLKGTIVTCPHCGKQSRLTGKTMTTRRWVLRKFAFLGAFAILGVIGIWIWIYGTIEHDIKALIALVASLFLVVVFAVYVALTIYHVVLIKTGREKPKA